MNPIGVKKLVEDIKKGVPTLSEPLCYAYSTVTDLAKFLG